MARASAWLYDNRRFEAFFDIGVVAPLSYYHSADQSLTSAGYTGFYAPAPQAPGNPPQFPLPHLFRGLMQQRNFRPHIERV